MKKVLLFNVAFSLVIFFMLTGIAYSADGPYISGHLGFTFLKDSDLSISY